ncbi:MAG TPA: pyridoxal-phosphate dependent enzyme [Myxococcales bacterium]|nr:pyridoxal-phosphate dependent enzyme [Myxococcales bacterium]
MSGPIALLDRPTPLLRWGPALLKLELLRPAGSTSGRAAQAWDWRSATQASIEATGNQALSAAGWARYRGVPLAISLRGRVTHEMREALELWGARIDSSAEPTLPRLDSDAAAPVFARTLGAELLRELTEAPPLLVCPAGERAALLGALSALRQRWPSVRGVALLAEDEELPDLPREAALSADVEKLRVGRALAARARVQVGRELGLLANHAGAAAAVFAHQHGGVALVTAVGEREFSLETAE